MSGLLGLLELPGLLGLFGLLGHLGLPGHFGFRATRFVRSRRQMALPSDCKEQGCTGVFGEGTWKAVT